MGINEFVEGALRRRGCRDPGPALSRFQYPSNPELGSFASSVVPHAQDDGDKRAWAESSGRVMSNRGKRVRTRVVYLRCFPFGTAKEI